MKTQEKISKKVDTSHKAVSKSPSEKRTENTHKLNNSEKSPWKSPDPTEPRRSTEKITRPYASTHSPQQTNIKSTTAERNAPVSAKKEYENYEDDSEGVNYSNDENEMNEYNE